MLLVDDHVLFLEGLKNLLIARGVEVVGTAVDGLEALAKARALHPTVILMDVRMPVCGGLVATRLIKAEMPDVQIVILTVDEEEDTLFEAIRCGASGFLYKSLDADEFLRLLSGLERGEPPLSPGLAARILAEFGRQPGWPEPISLPPSAQDDDPEEPPVALSPRQIGILTLVAQGLTYRRVGEIVGLSERTVKYHMGAILQQLHLDNRAEAIVYATRLGLVQDKRVPSE